MAILVAGTYERFLFGYKLPAAEPELGATQLVKSFTHAAHQGPVRCVAAGAQYVVSGGADDQLHIYDVRAGKDLGFLVNPGDGAVPCLEMYTPAGASDATHMFSGSADGSIGVWRAGGSWDHLKQMKGHKGAVNSLSVHPSGRLALSVAHDSALRMWDLLKGRCTYTAKLDAEGEAIAFTPSGQSYTLVCGAAVTVHSASGEGGVLAKLSHARRVTSVLKQQQDDVLLTGLEDGSLKLWDVRTSAVQQSVERAHGTRVRGLVAVSAATGDALPVSFASASSDGVIKLWDARMLASSGRCQELASVNTRARITCLCASLPAAAKQRQAVEAKARGKKSKGGGVQAADAPTTSAPQTELLGEPGAAPASRKAKQKVQQLQVHNTPARGLQHGVGTSGAGQAEQQQTAPNRKKVKGRASTAAAAGAAAATAASKPGATTGTTNTKGHNRTRLAAEPAAEDAASLRLDANAQRQVKAGKARKRKLRPPGAVQQRPGDEALVPRVQTRILHKSKKRRQEEDAELQALAADRMHDL